MVVVGKLLLGLLESKVTLPAHRHMAYNSGCTESVASLPFIDLE